MKHSFKYDTNVTKALTQEVKLEINAAKPCPNILQCRIYYYRLESLSVKQDEIF